MASPTAAEVLATALTLPREERARLARELIASLDVGKDAGAAEAWAAEIERRAFDVRTGAVALVDWSDVRARLSERWGDPRASRTGDGG